MAQHDYVIANGTGAAVRSDLNNALAAIVSQNSGATEPATTYAFQFWADTTTGSLKLRNSANSAWIELLQLDGTLTMEDGTEALPGLSFRNDLDTGLWRPGTNQLAISTNAVERVEFGASEVVFNDGGANYDFRVEGDTNANLLFVDASADAVGIGTSSPSTTTEIRGSGNTVIASNGNLFVADGGTATQTAGEGGQISFGAWLNGDTSAPYAMAAIKGITESSTTNVNSGALLFGSRDTSSGIIERMRIDSSGRVGIGTTSVQSRLHVSKGGAEGIEFYPGDSSNVNVSYHYNRSGSAWVSNSQWAASHVFQIQSTEAARIDTSGRLLVGTSTAKTNFENSSTTPQFQIESTSLNGASLSILRDNNDAGGPKLFLAHGRTDAGLVSDGDELGGIFFSGGDGSEFVSSVGISAAVDGTPGANDMPGRLVFSTTADGASSPTERMRITQAGVTKFSNNGSYLSATDNTHEINTNFSGNSVIHIASRNASFAADVTVSGCLRSANSAYRLLGCYSGDGSSTPFNDVEFNLRGDGNGYADGTWNGGGADYAEFFEWSDANPDEEDRRGISVVLDGEKIREAIAGEDPIGVISGNPSVIGDAAWNKWSGKYLRDEFGSYLLDENGDRQLNPAYDPDQEYIPREQRPEWDCVGLMGKLRIRKGQVTGSRWIKMRDISDSVEEWLVR